MKGLIEIAFLAMAPISELRGAIPLGILVYHLNPLVVVSISMIFNMVPAIAVILFFTAMMPWVKRRIPSVGKFVEKFSQTRQEKHREKIEKYGIWAIMVFVAIPFPLTGAWTGSLLSVLFEMPRGKSIFAIAGGIAISASIVTFFTMLGT